jgi:manganese-dependent inorganic pyrophosphatase
MEQKNKIWVMGHKNPDTDSICAAIAYTDLKNKSDEERYEDKCVGHLNEETKYVLQHFGVEAPEYVPDVGTQVKDIEIHKSSGLGSDISLKKAWERMIEEKIATLPVTNKDGVLEGLITKGDIATSYMEVHDTEILGRARTQYKNIVETLDGTLIEGNEHAYFIKGKVLVAAASPEMMEEYMEDDDLVILGNRYEVQLCALEMNASCLIVCSGAKIAQTIKKMAKEHGCVLISTPFDTYTVARLINQSMSVRYFMRRDNLITFTMDEYIDEVKEIMSTNRLRYFPVLDSKGMYTGMISRRNLLNMRRKQVILVDHNERTQAVDRIDEANILEIIDHHRLGNLETIGPVFFRNQPLGCTSTIIYQMYLEKGIEISTKIAGLLCAAIVSDTLMFRSPTCTEIDKNAATQLAEIAGVNIEELAMNMFQAGSDLKNKTPEEIFYQDFKTFRAGSKEFGVGQISAMSEAELTNVREKLVPYLDTVLQEKRINMVFVMLTNILEESTELISTGEDSKTLARKAFPDQENTTAGFPNLKGVVSRKKQFIPALMMAFQDE